jgi:hypothetical protein
MLEHLQTHRQILFDLTANYLERLTGAFQRLAFVSGLHRLTSNREVHDRLTAVYGTDPVNRVLAQCHEELFERLLEMPLFAQEDDLRRHVSSLPGTYLENLKDCREVALSWVPPNAPAYLTELYSSNLNALLELLLDNTTMAH